MNASHMRIYLLAGASIWAIAAGTPACAETASNGVHAAVLATQGRFVEVGNLAARTPQVGSTRVAAADTNPAGILESGPRNLLSIAPADQLEFDETVTNEQPGAVASASAAISCATSGECPNPGAIVQRAINVGGNAANSLRNEGEVRIDADANASGSAAIASAAVQTGIWQHASGVEASNLLSNGGSIGVSANANAVATLGSAAAFISLPFGAVTQSAISTSPGGAAANALTNSGSLGIYVSALASAAGSASAVALLSGGINQQAVGPGNARASNSLENDATIGIDLSASAQGGAAAGAVAQGSGAISQKASGGSAADSLANSGEISVSMHAAAAADDSAVAIGLLGAAVSQSANANGLSSDAKASLSNDGTMDLGAAASASADVAQASAGANGLLQRVTSHGRGEAAAAFINSGGFDLAASAAAQGVDHAAASAQIGGHQSAAVWQTAQAPAGLALDSITNLGSLSPEANADAVAATGWAYGAAGIANGILQNASGLVASATFGNSGSLRLSAQAAAGGHAGTAAAVIAGGIEQAAAASGTLTATGGSNASGDARVALHNDGLIAVAGSADAQATGPAAAVAFVGGAIDQFAWSDRGDAVATIANSGTMSVGAAAHASGVGGISSAYGFTWAVNGAHALANVSGALVQLVGSNGQDASAGLSNSGALSVSAVAGAAGPGIATTLGTGSNAYSVATGPHATALILGAVDQDALSLSTDASAKLANSGSIDVHATGQAHGGNGVAGFAAVSGAIYQHAQASAGDAAASLANSGTIDVLAKGEADAADRGRALAGGALVAIQQFAQAGDGNASASVANSGHISVGAVADAQAPDGLANAAATLLGALDQEVQADAGDASASLQNSGTLDVGAISRSAGSGPSFSTAYLRALTQNVTANGALSTASAEFDNSGKINIAEAVSASASDRPAAGAPPAHLPVASAVGSATGLMQSASGGFDAAEHIANSGSISFSAKADADAAGLAFARAHALGALNQQAAALTAIQVMDNSGRIDVAASANAVSHGLPSGPPGSQVLGGFASASAFAVGLGQSAAGAAASQVLTNSGTVNVAAGAFATGPGEPGPAGTAAAGFGSGAALAIGAFQSNNATSTAHDAFTNSGAINVHALASGSGSSGPATAVARGDYVTGGGMGLLTLDIANKGVMDVTASAVAAGHAYALARGIYVVNWPTIGDTRTDANPLGGSIVNSGTIKVVGKASGEQHELPLAGPAPSATITIPANSAFATGIFVTGGSSAMTIANSGSISVDAISANGRTAIAEGIVVLANAGTPAESANVLTIDNSGDLIVRQSEDDGKSWHRGLAINLAGNPARFILPAPNKSIINLLGGNIYGNIALRAAGDDVINVAHGETSFDGIINPVALPAGGITAVALDSGLAGVGTLSIGSGGTLFLRDRRFDAGFAGMYDGPSFVFMDKVNVASGGTLAVELAPTSAGNQQAGTYSQVFANALDITGGTLEARVTPAGGIFADNYSWDNVIDAGARSGTFDACRLGGAYGASVLLKLSCSYDSQSNVDLKLERIHFDGLAGLTRNQNSTGGASEALYEKAGATGLGTSALAPVVADLFRFDKAGYQAALDQLGGAAYAGYLQSFASLGYRFNSVLDRSTDCDTPPLGRSALECRTSPVRLWGEADHQSRKAAGDSELAHSSADATSMLLGLDAAIAANAVIGVSAGKVSNRVDFRDSGGSTTKGDGWQAGLYGVYDPGRFYLKALGTYSALDGKAHRHLDFAPFGGATEGALTGRPDVRLWTFAFHGGYRIPLAKAGTLTPFLSYDYTNAKLRRFTEDGTTGAELAVKGGTDAHSWLTGGAAWAGELGNLIGEARVGYRYRFGERRASFETGFAESPGADFDIVSASEARGALVAGLSVGGRIGPADLRIGYQGAYNGAVKEHAGYLRLTIPLGGGSAHASPASTPGQR